MATGGGALGGRAESGSSRSLGSSPIRIVRDDQSRVSPGVAGLYPVGEGAGYAGGIVSAGVDGLRTTMAIVAEYAPLDRARRATAFCMT